VSNCIYIFFLCVIGKCSLGKEASKSLGTTPLFTLHNYLQNSNINVFFYFKSVWFCREKSEHGWWNKRIQTREALGVTFGDPHHKIKATVMLLETRKNIFCQRSTLVTDLQHLLTVSNNVYRQRRKYQRGPRERQLQLDGGESSPDEAQTGLRHTSSRSQWAAKIN